MGSKTIVYVVRDVPHPKLPTGAVVFNRGTYELPGDSPKADRYRLADDFLYGPLERATPEAVARAPSYKAGMKP
jgi:hypothetical protein